jgi:hypothetical protein
MNIRRQITSNFTTIQNSIITAESGLSIGGRWLLIYLLSRPQDWVVRTSDIQKQGGIGREKAQGLLRELVAARWVRRDMARSETGTWDGIQYVIMDQPEDETSATPPQTGNPATVKPATVNQALTKEGSLPKTESTKLSSADDETEAGFEEFWAAYPKKPNNPRKRAMAAYRRVIKSKVSQKHLLNSVELYAAYVAGDDPKYIAMASTWLNDERWNCDFAKDAEVRTAYKAAKYGDPVPDADLIGKLIAAYPGGQESSTRDISVALTRSGYAADLPQIIEAAQKYALLLKQQKSDGFTAAIPELDYFIKFKWRDMNRYEFCRTGHLNRLSVRPKQEARV